MATWHQGKPVVHSGWLVKQGGRRKNWKRRWFSICANQIFYFKDPKDTVPLGAIQLFGNEVRVVPESEEPKKKFCFEVVPGGVTHTMMTASHRSFFIYASNKQEMDVWLSFIRKECYAPRGGGMFGTDLAATLEREGRSEEEVPIVVAKCVNFLLEKGLAEEGLFRRSGLATRINKLKEEFGKGENPELASETDIHVIASLLKMYLRELPEPLLTFQHHGEFIAAAQIYMDNANTIDSKQLLIPVRALLCKLRKCNVVLLKFLCAFLRQVLVHEQQNKMGIDNLATVFGPCLLRDPNANDPRLVLEGTKMVNVVVKMFLLEFDQVFSNLDVLRPMPRTKSWRVAADDEPSDDSDDERDEKAERAEKRNRDKIVESLQSTPAGASISDDEDSGFNASSSPSSPPPPPPAGPSAVSTLPIVLEAESLEVPSSPAPAVPSRASHTPLSARNSGLLQNMTHAELVDRVRQLESQNAALEEKANTAVIRYLEEWQTRSVLEQEILQLQLKVHEYEARLGTASTE